MGMSFELLVNGDTKVLVVADACLLSSLDSHGRWFCLQVYYKLVWLFNIEFQIGGIALNLEY